MRESYVNFASTYETKNQACAFSTRRLDVEHPFEIARASVCWDESARHKRLRGSAAKIISYVT
jgi:hypothetical protein